MIPPHLEMSDPSSPTAIVGTRGSDLALVQAETTENSLAAAFPQLSIQRRVIVTTGDRRTDVALKDVAKSEFFDKGVFIKEIEEALDSREIDIAVHSLKDMPTVLEPRFALAAVLERAPVRDLLITRATGGLEALPAGARVGTSSVRRAKQLEWLRPDLHVVDLRGNVPTRLRKLAEQPESYAAILLAEAGLVRLGYLPATASHEGDEPVEGIPGLFATRLPENFFFPAAGQGAIGLETRADDSTSRDLAQAIGHQETWLRVTAEREFLRLLGAGCNTPVGVFSSIQLGQLHLEARVFPESGGAPRTSRATGPAADPINLALQLFQSLS
jgi:hydroxymethylbilane synthase